MRIEITVKGTPKAQPRPRAFARKMGNGKYIARVYDDASAEGWKNCIAIAAAAHRPVSPLEGAVEVNVQFLFPRARDHFGTGRNANILKPSAPSAHVCKPDIDNCFKAVLDCLKTLAFFKDDSQVVGSVLRKRYVLDGEHPGALITIFSGQISEQDGLTPLLEMAGSTS